MASWFGFAVGALAIACSSSTSDPASSRVIITLGSDAARELDTRAAVVASSGEIVIAEIDRDQLGELATRIHEQLHRCGGFVVHDSLADAYAALAEPTLTSPRVDYKLDRKPLVTAILPTLDESRIRATIENLSSRATRYYKSPTGVEAAHWLAERWRGYTTRDDVTVELIDHNGWPQPSVIMTIAGHGERADEVVVIGGHLDSIAFDAAKPNHAPGADDDASGVATLDEVARALLAADYRPDRTLMFMAYAAEEVGLLGSQAIARDFARRKIAVVGALQLDMTNYRGSDRDIWLMKDFTDAAQNEFVIALIENYVGASWGLDACGYACSDHASWYRTGVPASMPFESRMREYNKAIHTRNDTLARSDDSAQHAIKFARLAAAYAIELAKGNAVATASETDPSPAERSWWRWIAIAGALAIGWAARKSFST